MKVDDPAPHNAIVVLDAAKMDIVLVHEAGYAVLTVSTACVWSIDAEVTGIPVIVAAPTCAPLLLRAMTIT